MSGCHVGLYNGFIFMNCMNMEAFVLLTMSNAASYGHVLKLVVQYNGQEAGVNEKWKCPVFLQEGELKKYELVRTQISGKERKFSLCMPEIKLKIATLFCAEGW